MNKTTAQKRKLTGIVVSNSMQKTVVVKVDSVAVHTKYKKDTQGQKNTMLIRKIRYL